jgi:hypothetical protein
MAAFRAPNGFDRLHGGRMINVGTDRLVVVTVEESTAPSCTMKINRLVLRTPPVPSISLKYFRS